VLETEFDRFAAKYSEQHAASIRLSGESPDYFAKYKIDDIVAALARADKRPDRIQDFGAGVGNSLPFMRAAFPGSEIVLLDPSRQSLDIARKRFPDQARFQPFNGVSIPFDDEQFDLVLAACVFHHIPVDQHVALLSEIARVLTRSGHFFLFEHNPINPLTRHAVRNCAFDENAVLIGAADMRKRLSAAGFRKSEVVYRIFFPRVLAKLRPLERFLTRIPLGAQYLVRATKPSA
jgi:ubiquinone/menaquinone biosynthesis C-methylase UbiE